LMHDYFYANSNYFPLRLYFKVLVYFADFTLS
jgi:hypothetical protein